MKLTEKRLLKVILARRQTFDSLSWRFGYQENMVPFLKRLAKKGLIKLVMPHNDGRFVFCRPDYPEKKLRHHSDG